MRFILKNLLYRKAEQAGGFEGQWQAGIKFAFLNDETLSLEPGANDSVRISRKSIQGLTGEGNIRIVLAAV